MRPARREDLEFLPSALEILATPPSPVRLALLVGICAFASLALVWSYFGRVDIIAVAQGKVQPTGRVKIIQPLHTGKVAAILAINGAHVAAGAPLIELDSSAMRSEESGALANLTSYMAEARRRDYALAAASARNFAPEPIQFEASIPRATQLREEAILRSDLQHLDSILASIAAQKRQKEAERDRLKATMAAQVELISTLQERVDTRTTLWRGSNGTRAGVVDAMETLQYQKTAMATLVGQAAEAEAGIDLLIRDENKAIDSFISENSQKRADAERQVDDLRAKLQRARTDIEAMVLRSPIDGVVQASVVTNTGQILSTGEDVMRVVPEGAPLEVEAYLPNKDIGFIAPGQKALIKVEALPFTRYGTLDATVVRVAADAIPEPDAQQFEQSTIRQRSAQNAPAGGGERVQNLVFPVTLRLDNTSVQADARAVEVSPGMTVTAEIKTGNRRIIDYLFSPLIEIGSRAGRER